MLNGIIKSKTMWFSLILAVLGVVQGMTEVFSPYMTPRTFGLFTFAVGAAVAILRVITTQPLSDK